MQLIKLKPERSTPAAATRESSSSSPAVASEATAFAAGRVGDGSTAMCARGRRGVERETPTESSRHRHTRIFNCSINHLLCCWSHCVFFVCTSVIFTMKYLWGVKFSDSVVYLLYLRYVLEFVSLFEYCTPILYSHNICE